MSRTRQKKSEKEGSPVWQNNTKFSTLEGEVFKEEEEEEEEEGEEKTTTTRVDEKRGQRSRDENTHHHHYYYYYSTRALWCWGFVVALNSVSRRR